MPTRHAIALMSLIVMFAAGLAACAKHPVSSSSAAPAPSPSQATATSPPAGRDSRSAGSTVAPVGAVPARPPAARSATPAAPSEYRQVDALKDIHFDFDRYDIRPEEARILEANVSWLRLHPNTFVLIEGHCDERGTDAYNLSLGDRRAKATMNYLMVHGVQASRIATISYGEEHPLCTRADDACRAQNRRAHILVKEG